METQRALQSAVDYVDNLVHNYPVLKACRQEVEEAVEALVSCFESGGKVLICGNGGSAADSEHIVGELMKSFMVNRDIDAEFRNDYYQANGVECPSWLQGALPAFSLLSQCALHTAFVNDAASEGVFAQQVYGYGNAGDVLIGISTSGNSKNVIEAAKVARAKKMAVIALTGQNESDLSRIANICIKAPAHGTPEIQELHLPIYHAICAQVESIFFCEEPSRA